MLTAASHSRVRVIIFLLDFVAHRLLSTQDAAFEKKQKKKKSALLCVSAACVKLLHESCGTYFIRPCSRDPFFGILMDVSCATQKGYRFGLIVQPPCYLHCFPFSFLLSQNSRRIMCVLCVYVSVLYSVLVFFGFSETRGFK